LKDRRNDGENICNSGDGTDQRVQSLVFYYYDDELFPYFGFGKSFLKFVQEF